MTTMIEHSVLYHKMKELKLTIEYHGRYNAKLMQQLFAISSKIFTAKLQFLHNRVVDI